MRRAACTQNKKGALDFLVSFLVYKTIDQVRFSFCVDCLALFYQMRRMRPELKLSDCPFFSTLIIPISRVISLNCQAESHSLKPFSGSPLLQEKHNSLKWYRIFFMIWPLISLEPYPSPHSVLQSPLVTLNSSRVTLLILTCASVFIRDITYPENFP